MAQGARVGPAALTGKVAIVTGASRGIGRAIAGRLAEDGAQLVVTARSLEALDEMSGELRAGGAQLRCVATPANEAQDVVSVALEAFGRIDVVVNNAGTTKRGSFTTLGDDDWADGFRVKVFGAVRMCRAAWPALVSTGGSIINIAGAGGRTPDAQFTIGGSVNAAVLAFTKALAQQGIVDGVQVNAINPGLIRTDRLLRRIDEARQRWGVGAAEAERRMVAEHRITRFGTPEEVAALVAYILSPAGRLLHGALIDADAGYTKGI